MRGSTAAGSGLPAARPRRVVVILWCAIVLALTVAMMGRVTTASASFSARTDAPGSSATAGTWLLHLKAATTGDQPAQLDLPLSVRAPSMTTLPRLATQLNNGSGRRLLAGGTWLDTDLTRNQYWHTTAPAEGLPVTGTVRVHLWASAKENESHLNRGVLHARLYDCASPRSSCVEVGPIGTVDANPWGTASGQREAIFALGTINHTVPGGRHLVLQVVAGAGSTDMWLAYDVTTHPSRLTMSH